MNNISIRLIVLFFVSLTFQNAGSSQSGLTKELDFEVNRIYPFISISKAKLSAASAIRDLNNDANDLEMVFKSSWIRAYVSVEIMAICNGEIRKAAGKSDIFNHEQKEIMINADAGTGISVKVRYMPENTLAHNDIKELNFTFMIVPDREARFSGGQRQLDQYLMDHAMAQIPYESFSDQDLVAVKFTIGEAGEIIDAHVFESEYQTDRNEKVDKLLLEAVRRMPRWEPAQYANGTKVRQEFVLTVGNMDSCVINLLNIRRS